MRAIQIERPGVLRLTEIEPPEPGPSELLVKVHACGVCRTDLHLFDGEVEIPHPPIVPGHQIVGTVCVRSEGPAAAEPLRGATPAASPSRRAEWRKGRNTLCSGRAQAVARANRDSCASRRVGGREPPCSKGSCLSAGHHALDGALAGGTLREARQVVPQVRRELIRKADALRESERASDNHVSHREASAHEIVASVQGA
jgi:threonine dehydrogenase-like Zn-dependent dehydrogenase